MILLIAALMLYIFALGMLFTLWAQEHEHDVLVLVAGILAIYAMFVTACLIIAGIYFLLQFGN